MEMRNLCLAIAAASLVNACSGVSAHDTPLFDASGASCEVVLSEELAASLIGLTGGEAIDRLRRIGVARVRGITDGEMVTLDFDIRRANVYMDRAARVHGVACG